MTHTHKIIDGIKVDLTAEEIAELNAKDNTWNNGAFDRALENLRIKRNALLQETDWWASSDLTMTDEQKNYRKDLRDITEGLTTEEEVKSVVFPTKPN
tara:strand:- start:56 stop:349 length:294 start_codon:yes stop_codon:yes gene_type:complete